MIGTTVSDHTFALAHLLGFRFAPRIPNLADRRLYTFGPTGSWPMLAPFIAGRVDEKLIMAHWDVGVSAVRDLFGTVVNEGASKGILVTTSGFGKAAFDFANGKPLELLDGANLLHLLGEHANIDARIVMPDDWVDPPVHGE